MKICVVIAGVALTTSASLLSAQANICPGGGQSPLTVAGAQSNAAKDACTMAVDVFQFVAPQLGLALAGGNATIGQGGTLGGPGHFAISVRGNVYRGDLPQVQDFPVPSIAQNQPPRELPSDKQIMGLPIIDAALGIFKGFPLGLTNVGGVDLLLSATFVPTIGSVTSDVRIEPESNFKFGFGARVGLLQESLVIPGIAVTYVRRDVPTTTITGSSSSITIDIQDASMKTSAWRIVANKNLIAFGLAAGYGQDTYDQSATVRGTASNIPFAGGQTFGPVSASQKLTRTNMFADLSVNLLLAKIVAEVGRVSGGDVSTFNTFSSGNAGDARLYGSLGLRFGF